MTRLLSMLSGWQGYAAAAALSAILASGATFYFTSLGYRLTISQMETASATASAEAFKAAAEQFAADARLINEAATEYAAGVSASNRRFAAISKDLKDAIATAPLSDACPAIDAGRLSALKAATAAANTATGRDAVPAVPGNP